MAKVFDYAVIYNGVFYPANTPIEDKEPEKEAVTKSDKRTSKKSKAGDSAE